MTDSMIERVANAISRRRADEAGGCYSDLEEGETCDDTQCKCRDDALIDARAAIEAMREPTEDMIWAGGQAQQKCCGSYGEPEVTYRHMIDAALQHQEPEGE